MNATASSTIRRTRQLGAELRVAKVVRETDDTVSLCFDVPRELADEFAYKAGQFITIRVPAGDTGYARSYSLSSAPGIDDLLTITIKRAAGGRASGWLVENAQIGMTFRVLPPSGVFTVSDDARDLLLIAAGSGVTPVFSILKSALQSGSGRVTVVTSHRTPADAIFLTELSELQAAHPGRLTVISRYTATDGRLTAEQLALLTEGINWQDAFICGPEKFMSAARIALRADPSRRVHLEEFTSLEGDPFELEEVVTDSATAMPAQVHLDGQTHDIDWPPESTLVDVLLSRGVRVPYSCREGDCGSCISKLTQGRVEMACTDALEEEDIEDGYILACQARPLGGPLRVDF
ncbi:ferredoxin--NADP reductase [Microbacterium gorillae]|uniref:ferredoxin--NADP reductase n=1 Tax=Microbacterium gorillae TaxID=1231063 RepID=UPI00058D1B8A|nr:ferredoxin--NADP reductase [Microbacterium gorillae]